MGTPANARQRTAIRANAMSNDVGTRSDNVERSARDRHAVPVPILSVFPGDSPRLNGEDKAHIARLAETETPLPPILVDRRTMKVVDGMHRLMAASLQGRETIDVVFFDGSSADLFLRAVEENVTHGLPLSQTDRRVAAERIIGSHPQMSDRAIGRTAGLAAKTVASIRRRLTGDTPQLNARVGRDGRIRPLDSGQARLRAADILKSRPEASLRDVAKAAGISPATVLDVRKRMERGEAPVPAKPQPRRSVAEPQTPPDTVPAAANTDDEHDQVMAAEAKPRPTIAARREELPPHAMVEKLLRDPSLRNSEDGRSLLRLLHVTTGADQLPGMSAAVPPHCVHMIAQVASQYAQMWQTFATELSHRARVIDPAGRH